MDFKINNDGYIGFNSQWDGILQKTPFMLNLIQLRFNSQRDGILPESFSNLGISNSFVSIPNGMEFYAG